MARATAYQEGEEGEGPPGRRKTEETPPRFMTGATGAGFGAVGGACSSGTPVIAGGESEGPAGVDVPVSPLSAPEGLTGDLPNTGDRGAWPRPAGCAEASGCWLGNREGISLPTCGTDASVGWGSPPR
jgi:hypothetical protein